jgi:hypothetical protein
MGVFFKIQEVFTSNLYLLPLDIKPTEKSVICSIQMPLKGLSCFTTPLEDLKLLVLTGIQPDILGF